MGSGKKPIGQRNPFFFGFEAQRQREKEFNRTQRCSKKCQKELIKKRVTLRTNVKAIAALANKTFRNEDHKNKKVQSFRVDVFNILGESEENSDAKTSCKAKCRKEHRERQRPVPGLRKELRDSNTRWRKELRNSNTRSGAPAFGPDLGRRLKDTTEEEEVEVLSTIEVDDGPILTPEDICGLYLALTMLDELDENDGTLLRNKFLEYVKALSEDDQDTLNQDFVNAIGTVEQTKCNLEMLKQLQDIIQTAKSGSTSGAAATLGNVAAVAVAMAFMFVV